MTSQKLLDLWLPPEDAGQPLACLATSFTFEVDFFESQCLGRFLNLDWKRGESEGGDELAFLIEQEEKLAEARVSVIVDRSFNPEGRSLRWDILPVGVKAGVMHAKVTLLMWERLVRVVVSSANLTPAGYRSQLEAAAVLDAHGSSTVPAQVFEEMLVALRALVNRFRGRSNEQGAKQRALQTLDDAARLVAGFALPVASSRTLPRISVALGRPGQPVLDQIDKVWGGGRKARRAVVLSPFFDGTAGPSQAVRALGQRLATGGRTDATFVVPAEVLESRTTVHAPDNLLSSVARSTDGQVCQVREPGDGEPRRLHAKALTLESDRWTATLIGSSNFTAAGLGIGGVSNLEINLVFGAPSGSAFARSLRGLIPIGPRIESKDAAWEAEEPEDEVREPELPWGFVQALLDPATPAALRLQLDPREELPPVWSVTDPSGRFMADSLSWKRAGRPRELTIALHDDSLPFFVTVRWEAVEGEVRATWPVNVADASALPPPEELRDLPVDALIRALASTRPLHESLVQALRDASGPASRSQPEELDPLKRFSSTGHLLARAKQMSLALAGLRRRLERPAASAEALEWRLTGPFGPRAIAEGLVDQARERGAVPGEAYFLLAELALTLSRTDWRRAGSLLPGGTRVARRHARKALGDLTSLREQLQIDGRGSEAGLDPLLAGYVAEAFARAKL